MKTNKFIFLFSILLLSWILNGCVNSECRLKGCSREAIGWDYYTEHQPGVFGGCIGACRMKDYGGYCSKNHVIQDL